MESDDEPGDMGYWLGVMTLVGRLWKCVVQGGTFMAVWYKAEGAGGARPYGGQAVEATMVVQIGGASGGDRKR